MNVKEMIAEYLFCGGYDGLYNDGADCCCEAADLFPCGDVSGSCKAGYKFVCNSGCGEYNFCIGEEKKRGCERDERQWEKE